MRHAAFGVVLAAAGSWAGISVAQEGNAGPHDFVEQRFKLDTGTGCWSHLGKATVFTGHFKAGAYIGIQMVTIGQDGFPVPFDQEERMPGLDAPEVDGPPHQSWYGPLPSTKDYSFMYAPRAAFGSTALVTICGRTTAPGNG
jgi:hypothetical protein